jgi:uncharacterized membrane protein HdeD (DUF308 family)
LLAAIENTEKKIVALKMLNPQILLLQKGKCPMTQEIQNLETPFINQIKTDSGLTIAVGVILLLMGLLVMGSPLVAGISITIMVGAMLIFGGISQLVFAFKAGKQVFAIVLGALNVIIGCYMVSNPGVALASLTIFLAIFLIISGISEAMMSLSVRPTKGWGWSLFSGIVSVLLGVMIWNQFPLSGAWAIGILIGVRLISSGWTLLMLGVMARNVVEK